MSLDRVALKDGECDRVFLLFLMLLIRFSAISIYVDCLLLGIGDYLGLRWLF